MLVYGVTRTPNPRCEAHIMSEDTTNGAGAEPEVTAAGAAVSDGAYTLFVADFSDTETAWSAFQELKALEDGATCEIDGVVVVKREADGTMQVQKATDHSTRSGLTWGVVGGVVLGVIFPPSILGSAAVLGAAGAAGGKLRQRHHRKGLAEALTTVTMALWDSEPSSSRLDRLREYLRNEAFNTAARAATDDDTDPADQASQEVRWAFSHSLPLAALLDRVVCRRAVEACGLKLDGTPAAPSTTARKRSALFSCLEFAVEKGPQLFGALRRIGGLERPVGALDDHALDRRHDRITR